MISKFAKQLATLYLDDTDVDLEDSLAKIASDNNLNAQSIERVVARTNRNIIVGLQKEAVKSGKDPHFTFPTMKTAGVLTNIKTNKPSARPTLPEKTAGFAGIKIADSRPSRVSEVDMSAYIGQSNSDPDIAFGVLQMLQCKMASKKSDLFAVEAKLDDLTRSFEKNAANALLGGTPIEVLQSLPVGGLVSGVHEKLEEWGHKVAHTSSDFDLDFDDPVVGMAFEISELRDNMDEATTEYNKAKFLVDEARRDVRESTK